jgi:CHASE2 domain-containing sensor protein
MHLNVLAATMDHEFLRKLPVALDLVIVAVFGLLAWLLLDRVGRWLICLLSFLGFGVGYLLLAFLLYNLWGIFVPIVPPLLTLLASVSLGSLRNRYTSVRMAWFMVRSFQNKSRCHPPHFAFGSLDL